jgi:simple sugar transport system permease protein
VPGSDGVMWVVWQLVALAAGLAVAVIIGLVNGYLVAYLGVSAILATLGTMTTVKGLAIGLTRGGVLSGFPAPVVFIGNGTVLGVPFSILVFLACAVPVAIWLARTPTGNAIYLIGSNERAARFSGNDPTQVMLRVYVLSSVLAAIAGIVMMARFNSANASYGESYLLVAILVAVLGGTDPFGGFGRVTGLILALLLLQVISSAFNLMGISQFLTLAIWGAILIAATAFTLRFGPHRQR